VVERRDFHDTCLHLHGELSHTGHEDCSDKNDEEIVYVEKGIDHIVIVVLVCVKAPVALFPGRAAITRSTGCG